MDTINENNFCREYYHNGKRHREDGPAVEWSYGTKEWFINGERHREDGPAIEFKDGTKSWYLNGKRLSEEEFNRLKDGFSKNRIIAGSFFFANDNTIENLKLLYGAYHKGEYTIPNEIELIEQFQFESLDGIINLIENLKSHLDINY